MNTFKMVRNNDESHVSGTGEVLQGIIFDNGQVVVSWKTKQSSLGIYKNFMDFYDVHIKSHPSNDTELIFVENEYTKRDEKVCFCGQLASDHPTDNQSDVIKFNVRLCNGKLKNLI